MTGAVVVNTRMGQCLSLVAAPSMFLWHLSSPVYFISVNRTYDRVFQRKTDGGKITPGSFNVGQISTGINEKILNTTAQLPFNLYGCM